MDEHLIKNILTRGTEYIEEVKSKDDDFTHLLSDLEDCVNAAGKETWKELELQDEGDGQYHLTKLLTLLMSLKIATRDTHTVSMETLDSTLEHLNDLDPDTFYLIKQVTFAAFSLGRASGKVAARLAAINNYQVAPETETENPTITLSPA